MLGKVQILALLTVLVLSGSAATMAMTGGDFNDEKPFHKTIFKVDLVKVEALYDHEVYIRIGSKEDGAIHGTVELIKLSHFFRECPELDHHKEEQKMCPDDEIHERDKELHEEDWEGEHQQDEDDETHEEREEHEREDEEDREEDERDVEEECEKVHDREHERPHDEDRECDREQERFKPELGVFRFKFENGKGRLLLFPSSHKFLGFSAIVTVFSKGKVRVVPYIFVKNTKVHIFPDTVDDDGNRYCVIDKFDGRTRYGFEDLKDSPEFECDWDYDDVVFNVVILPAKRMHGKEKVRVYTLKVRWGQLDGLNEEHEEMIPWDGSIFVGNGKVELIRPLLFEHEGEYEHGGDDLIYHQNSPNEIQRRSSTTVHWDGMVVRILVFEGHPETHVAVHTAQWSGVFDVKVLAKLYERFEINDIGDEIEINGFEMERGDPCPRHPEPKDEGEESVR